MARAAGVEVEDFIEFFRDPPEVASLKMLSWNDRELGGDGFVFWKPFDHPQLARVELGAGKPSSRSRTRRPNSSERSARS
jgi:hypothetical protein